MRSLLHKMGRRFRLDRKDLPGNPDITLPKLRKVIFVHGCFWHGHEGCPRAARPTSNREFWDRKLSANIERHKTNIAALEQMGWKVLVIWTCRMRDQQALSRILTDFLEDRP